MGQRLKNFRNTVSTLRSAGAPGPKHNALAIQARAAGRPTPAAANAHSKAHNYMVHAPVTVAGHGQQIRATIGGTPQVAGSVEINPAGAGKVYISNLRVEQQHRRQGVASKLIDAAISTARRQGFRAAALEARPSDNGISSQAL